MMILEMIFFNYDLMAYILCFIIGLFILVEIYCMIEENL